MTKQHFLAVLLYLIKTILILRELIQHSSLGSKILVGVSPGVQDVLLLFLGVCPSPGCEWTCRMSCAGGPWVCAVSILVNICTQVDLQAEPLRAQLCSLLQGTLVSA